MKQVYESAAYNIGILVTEILNIANLKRNITGHKIQ